MVEQFETGKYYKCIDMDAFAERCEWNGDILSKFFDKYGVVFVDGIKIKTDGYSIFKQGIITGYTRTLVTESEKYLFKEVKRGNKK